MGIQIAHWNRGSSYLMNKQAEIETIVAGYKPSVLGISECCFKQSHNVEDVSIEQYETIFSKTLSNQSLNCSRISVYVDKEINKKIRLDLMSETFSSIWLELGHPRQKKILVCQLYRDWAYLGQSDAISGSTQAQLTRWLEFLSQWEAALSENKEVVVLGDCNLNFLTFNEACSDHVADAQTNKLKSLVQALFSRILPLGVTQCVQVATRHWPGHTPSGLDHLYTTNPSKLSDVQAVFQGGSDHKLIFATRYSKSIVRKPRIIKKRCYKNFDPEKFIQELQNTRWWDIYACTDVNEAVKPMAISENKRLD